MHPSYLSVDNIFALFDVFFLHLTTTFFIHLFPTCCLLAKCGPLASVITRLKLANTDGSVALSFMKRRQANCVERALCVP